MSFWSDFKARRGALRALRQLERHRPAPRDLRMTGWPFAWGIAWRTLPTLLAAGWPMWLPDAWIKAAAQWPLRLTHWPHLLQGVLFLAMIIGVVVLYLIGIFFAIDPFMNYALDRRSSECGKGAWAYLDAFESDQLLEDARTDPRLAAALTRWLGAQAPLRHREWSVMYQAKKAIKALEQLDHKDADEAEAIA